MATTSANAKNTSGLKMAQMAYNMMSPAVVQSAGLPEPSADNYAEFMNGLKNSAPAKNNFLDCVNQIVMIYIDGAEDRNPFFDMVKGTVGYGDTIEQIFVDSFTASDWNSGIEASYNETFGRANNTTYSIYYSSNFHKKTKGSIQDITMNKAAKDWSTVNNLIAEIIDKLYTGMIGEEAEAAAALLNMAHKGGWCYVSKVKAFDITDPNLDATMKANTIVIKSAANRLYVRGSRKYNYMGVLTRTDFDNMYLWLLPEYLAAQDVEVLASSFHMDKAEFLGHVVMCDSFGGCENEGTVAFLTDKRWFQIWYQNKEVTYSYNAGSRLWNYFYFVDAYFAIGTFFNCVEFSSQLKTITNVEITASQKAAKGVGTDIQVTVTNGGETGAWSSKCTWSISGQASERTYISPFGRLFVGPDETAGTINVTATSDFDKKKTSTVAVTVTA